MRLSIPPVSAFSAILVVLLACAAGASAQDGPLKPGDGVVTQFSGTVTTLAPDQSLARRIDPEGAVVKAIGLSAPGFRPAGQHWVNEPQRVLATAAEIGQVFGIAFDDAEPANIYVAATAVFGLHRTADGTGWMEGLRGPGGGAGTIWKLDAQRGYAPAVFARVGLEGRANSGAGVGNIAYDPVHRLLLASDLETGTIHAFRIEDGTEHSRFDHGTAARPGFVDAQTAELRALPPVPFAADTRADPESCTAGPFATTPACWNLADFRRRVWGLAMWRDPSAGQTRLLYALWSDTGFGNPEFDAADAEERTNAVWSVALDDTGAFRPETARREFLVPPTPGAQRPRFAISDLAIPKRGPQDRLLLGRHRGLITRHGAEPGAAWPDQVAPEFGIAEPQLWRLDAAGVWRPAEAPGPGGVDLDYPHLPGPPLGENTAGGVDFGFGLADGRADAGAYGGFAWIAANRLCPADAPCFEKLLAAGQAPSDPAGPEGGQGFDEAFPAFDMPDLAVAAIAFDPPRAGPGAPVTVSADLANNGTGASAPARVTVSVDGAEIGVEEVGALAAGERRALRMAWIAEGPGPHRVTVAIAPAPGQVDGDASDNRLTRRLWVAGAAEAQTDLELSLLPQEERGGLILEAHNPAFAPLPPVPATLRLDGEAVGEVTLGPVAPGETARLAIDTAAFAPGEHVLSLEADLPDRFHDRALRGVTGWHVGVPGLPGGSFQTAATWRSIGPRLLVNAQPDNSQGRVDHLAVHPADSSLLFASAVRGGLWKSTDGGQSWQNLTDALSKQFSVAAPHSPLQGGAIALDPADPDIVYYGTGSSRYGGGVGIFKSADGGATWHRIAPASVAGGVSALHAARLPGGEALLYAATDRGLLRLTTADPAETAIGAGDWVRLWPGSETDASGKSVTPPAIIEDMVVDPDDAGRVYIADIAATRTTPDGKNARVMKGLYRCEDADTATGAAGCTALTSGLPAMDTNSSIRIDAFRDDPRTLYAAITRARAFDAAAPRLAIYRSDDRGQSWSLKAEFGDKEPDDKSLYNPFLRVHPADASVVWFGGVKLFKMDFDDAQPAAVALWPPHDDQHGMVFDPGDDSVFYVTGDGGVWRCKVQAGADSCTHRNSDLRAMELYDLDAAENDPGLMTAGTQDNGTIVFTGSPDWNQISDPRGGDGAYSPISPADPDVMISQHQHMHSDKPGRSTWISASGPEGPWIMGLAGDPGLPQQVKDLYVREAYLTFHPTNPDVVATVGDQVYATDNARAYTTDAKGRRISAAVWTGRGPKGATVEGDVSRVLFQPGTGDWYAGTSKGQIWRSPHGIAGTWKLIWTNADKARVRDMAFAPTDNGVLYVLFAGGDVYNRILRLQGLNGSVTGTPIGANFPANRDGRAISGDGYDAGKVYVGTDKGVFEADMTRPTYDRWQPFNDGLPLVRINDLVVPTGRAAPAGPVTFRSPERVLIAATRGRGVWIGETGP